MAAKKTTTSLYMICILRKSDECLVASFSTSKGLNTDDVTEIVAEKLNKMTAGKRYSEPGDDGINVHFTLDTKGRIFALMTRSNYPQRVAFQILEELKEAFGAEFGSLVKTAKPNSLSKDSKTLLKSFIDKYADPTQSGDTLSKVQSKLDRATDTMKENIQIAIKNTEMIEDIEDKSEALEKSAAQFSKNAVALRNKMWWKKVKTYLLIGGLITAVLLIIIVPVAVQASAAAAAAKAGTSGLSGSSGPAADQSAPAPTPLPTLPVPTAKPTKKVALHQ